MGIEHIDDVSAEIAQDLAAVQAVRPKKNPAVIAGLFLFRREQ